MFTFQNLKKSVPLLVITALALLIGLQSAGQYMIASDYAARFNFLPPDHLPLADSDCYKWGNVLRSGIWEWTDDSEDPRATGPVSIQWGLPTKLYLKSLHAVFSMFLLPSKAESWTLFFAMPVLVVLMGGVVSCFCLFALRSVWLSTLLPFALLLMPAIQSQMVPGRPDHHGPMVFAVAMFTLSLFQPIASKGAWLWSALFASLALWISPLNFVPILGILSMVYALPRLFPFDEFAPSTPSFWKKWAISTSSMTTLAWLVDYLPRGTQIHMEALNPFWAASMLGGGFLMSGLVSLAGWSWPALNRREWISLLWPLGLIALPLIMLLSSSMFWTSSEEIRWVLKEVNEMKAGELSTLFTAAPLMFVALLLLNTLPKHKGLPILAFLAFVASSLYLWQIRWMPLSVLIPLIFASVPLLIFPPPSRWGRLAIMALLSQSVWYTASSLRTSLENIKNPKGAPEMYNVAMFSAMASRMAKEQGETLVLSTPNLTSGMFYMNGVRGIGSVYWESKKNLRFASEIFGSLPSSEDRVREILKENNIRMLAITPQVLDTAYVGMSGNWDKLDQTLVVRLIKGEVPPWLKVIARVNQPWPGLGLYKVVD